MLWSLLPAKLFIWRAFVIIFKVLKIKWFNLKKKKTTYEHEGRDRRQEGRWRPPLNKSRKFKTATLSKKELQHKCFPVNFAKFFIKRLFSQNTSGQLLLAVVSDIYEIKLTFSGSTLSSRVPFYSPWKYTKTKGSPMFSWGSNRNIGKKRINATFAITLIDFL